MKGRVLIIDDEAEIRRNLTVGLTQEGYSAVACPDGISAIHELDTARAKGGSYDYLVTDIFMPDIDGLKILKVIKIQYPDLPVLVPSGLQRTRPSRAANRRERIRRSRLDGVVRQRDAQLLLDSVNYLGTRPRPFGAAAIRRRDSAGRDAVRSRMPSRS